MSEYKRPNHIKIIYFTGTGCTSRVADTLAVALNEHGVHVSKYELNVRVKIDETEKEDLLIVTYPVYALNEPKPVYDYFKLHTVVDHTPVAVISVSGGGEVTPNKASRLHLIKLLQKKGYHVVYEKMLVMLSNCLTPTPDALSVCLLEALPSKINKIVDDLLSGAVNRTHPDLLNRTLAIFGRLENKGAKKFGRSIKANSNCTGCSLCAASCPMGNITISENKPVFGFDCSLCLRCIYGCPEKALSPGFGKSFVFKQGFSLASIESKMSEHTDIRIEDMPKSYIWNGIKKYLTENH